MFLVSRNCGYRFGGSRFWDSLSNSGIYKLFHISSKKLVGKFVFMLLK
jgi:hypothetical protein